MEECSRTSCNKHGCQTSRWKDWYWNRGGRDKVQFSRKTKPVLLQLEKENEIMKREGKVYCMGIQCSIRNQCLRYTEGLGATLYDGIKDTFVRKCTNQRLFVQDTNNIVKGR